MFNYGHVVTPAAFQVWARGLQAREARIGILRDLPPYALTYDPTVIPQLGKDIVKVAGHHRRQRLLLPVPAPVG